MIVGQISSENLEAKVRLAVVNKGKSIEIEFVIDTGFSGYIAVPLSVVETLNLEYQDLQRGILADGKRGLFDTVDLCVFGTIGRSLSERRFWERHSLAPGC